MRSKEDKIENTLVNNLTIMASEKHGRYDIQFLYYCIKRLASENGQSIRFVLCSLLSCGLAHSEVYSSQVGKLRREFDAGPAV